VIITQKNKAIERNWLLTSLTQGKINANANNLGTKQGTPKGIG
jgi:hypothetical protein